MNGKKVNLAFLISIILYFLVMFGAAYLFPALMNSMILNNLICELVIVLPGLLFVIFLEKNPAGFLHFQKMKIGTMLVIVPFTLFSMPVISLVNLISQLFTENQSVAVMESYQIGSMPFWRLLLSVGIFGPFCEELICRGIYYRGYRKSGSTFKAMMLSSLLFALLHMNINQAMYAFVMGVMAVLLVEATGSLLSSVLYHMLINSSQIFAMYRMLQANPSAYSEASAAINTESLIFMLAGYLVIVAVTLPLAWGMLVWMCGHEGRRGTLPLIWKERKEKEDKMLTISLVIALILCLVMMILPYIISLYHRVRF